MGGSRMLWVVLAGVGLAVPTARSKSPEFEVDLVYTWVNGSDPKWLKLRQEHEKPNGTPWDANAEHRFRSNDELRYSLRSMRDNAPWVRNVFIVTCCGQKPSWLKDNDRVQVIDHNQIFPAISFDPPTFNSFAIETWVHRIPNLAEHFLLMNDDFFFGGPVEKSDFFDGSGKPKIAFQEEWGINTVPPPNKDDAYLWASHNCDVLLDSIFSTEPRYKVLHQAYPVTKSLYLRAHDLFAQQLTETTRHAFRERSDVIPHFLAEWVGIYEGKAIKLSKNEYPSHLYVRLDNSPNENRQQLLNLLAKSGEYKLFCIGDHMTSNPAAQESSEYIRDFFEAYFGPKAPWER